MLIILAQSPAQQDPVTWAAIGFGIVLLVYLMMRSKAKKRDPLQGNTPRFSLSQQRAVESQMQNLLVELSEMSRQMTSQLDTRSAKLEQLIKDADERLERLEQATRASNALSAIANHSATPDEQPRVATMKAQPLDPRHAQVYTLADQGISTPDIASQLNRPRGEIELILALRPAR